MRKISLFVLAIAVLIQGASACSDVFINFEATHIEARSMDFGLNMAMNDFFGFIGQKNTTDVVIDSEKIPPDSLTSWTNKYGYWGRDAFNTGKLTEGMNTEGLSLSGLYLSEVTKYPAFDSSDKRPVLAFFDIGNFLLSQAKNVDEALALVKSRQIVQSAMQVKPGVFLKGVPIHIAMRDPSGRSAVIESIEGKIVIYAEAGDVLTNGPQYPEQLELVKAYNPIVIENSPSLTGMPGGYSSLDRFARGTILLRNLPKPNSLQEALYQADFVISSLASPFLAVPGAGNNSNTIWKVLKDLDRRVVYTNNVVYFQGGGKIAPTDIANNGYTIIDLNSIDFSLIPVEFEGSTIQPTPASEVKMIISANDIAEFGE